MKITESPKPDQFEEGSNAPNMPCNSCGKTNQAKFTYSIPLQDLGIEGDAMIVCCSKHCVEQFCAHPGTPAYINDLIYHIVQMNDE